MVATSNTAPASRMRLCCLGLCYVLSALVSGGLATCPPDVMRAAQLCTAGMSLGPQPSAPSAFVAGGSVDRARRACREHELSRAVHCLEELMDSCKGNTEGEQLLRMLVDTKRMRVSVDNFCSRIEVYEQHAPCIVASQKEQVACARETQRNFLTKIRATSNSDVMITSTCRFHNKAMSCSSTIIRAQCGNEAADMVTDMLLGFQPPKCLEINEDSCEGEGGQSDATGSNVSTRTAARDFTLAVFAAVTAVVGSMLTSPPW